MTRPLGSVDNALRLIVMLQDGRPVRVTDAAQVLDVSRATAHRLLATLESRRFVEQDPVTRAYVVGETLARNWLPQPVEVFAAVEPEMRALARNLRETIHLAALHGTTVTIVGSVDGGRLRRTFVGTTFPAHFSAAGLALLAELSVDDLRRRYSTATLRKTAWRAPLLRESDTMLWSDLLGELLVVRQRGYATNFTSRNRSSNAIACSLQLAAGTPLALVVNAPSARTGRHAIRSYATPLRAAAAQARLRYARLPAHDERT